MSGVAPPTSPPTKFHEKGGYIVAASIESAVDRRSEIPYGYCQCGCGQRTLPYTKTRRSRGEIKGQPRKFIDGHESAGARNPRYNMGLSFSKGYWQIVCRDLSKVPYSHAVMEAHLQRNLVPGEVVHHINHIKTDDRPENLLVLPSNSVHKHLYHRKHSTMHLLLKLRHYCLLVGRPPRHKDLDATPWMPGANTYKARFGSLSNAIKEAGLVGD